MKLWDKGYQLDRLIERFTVGEDPVLDLELLPFDCKGSLAHARMLQRIGLLEASELAGIERELGLITEEALAGTVVIPPELEDCHTWIEDRLTRVLGEAGKKIHAGRSRNDQVLMALRLYSRDRLAMIRQAVVSMAAELDGFAARTRGVPLPGYTHTRKAMPSSTELWAGAYRDALRDDLILIDAVDQLIDQSPLGTGAGYGVPLPLDRGFTAGETGFSRVQENPVYAQLSRGKFECSIVHALSQVMFDLNRLATDLILFSLPEMGLFTLPVDFCTGSSLMPQKKNPDVLELLRASLHVVTSCEARIRGICSNQISGYHRDLQLTKRPLMEAFATTGDALAVARLVITGLGVDEPRCRQAMTSELYATERACELVKAGVPFRDAYRRVAAEFAEKPKTEQPS